MSNLSGMFGHLGLTPATLAGLSNVSGVPVDDEYAAEFAADQEEQRKFAAQNGLPEVKPLAPPPVAEDGARLYTDPSANSKATGQTSPILANGPMGTPAVGAEPVATPPPNAPGAVDGEASVQPMMPYAPTQTIPAHWQPGTHEVEVRRGIDPNALAPGMAMKGQSFGEGDQAAQARLAASQLTLAADVDAGKRAAVQMHAAQNELQQLESRRKQYIQAEQQRLNELNTQANAKVNTDEAFVGGNVGRLMAAVAMGIGQFAAIWKGGNNAAMQIINDAVNSTIERQKANAQIARGAFADRNNLYRQNLDAFGEDRAALATKIQLLDKVSQLADERKAKAGSLVNEASYLDTKKALDGQRAEAYDQFVEKSADRYGEKMNESFRPAMTVGGPGSMKREGNLVTLPDGTTFVMPSDKTADKAIEKIQNLDVLQRRNNDILQLRQKAAKLDPIVDYTEYNKTIARLQELADEKVALMSIGLGQGTVKEDEYKRAQQFAANATNGLGTFKGNPIAAANREAAEAVLRAQNEKWAKDMRSYVTTAGGSVYKRGYVQDATGQLKPAGQYTGQDATPTEHLAPNGSKALDGKTQIPTPGPKTGDLIPPAPRMGVIPPRPTQPVPTKKGR